MHSIVFYRGRRWILIWPYPLNKRGTCSSNNGKSIVFPFCERKTAILFGGIVSSKCSLKRNFLVCSKRKTNEISSIIWCARSPCFLIHKHKNTKVPFVRLCVRTTDWMMWSSTLPVSLLVSGFAFVASVSPVNNEDCWSCVNPRRFVTVNFFSLLADVFVIFFPFFPVQLLLCTFDARECVWGCVYVRLVCVASLSFVLPNTVPTRDGEKPHMTHGKRVNLC